MIRFPTIVGAGAAAPSSVASTMAATSSPAAIWSAPADATVVPSDGAEDETLGFVLSTRRLARPGEVVELPALSTTITRRS